MSRKFTMVSPALWKSRRFLALGDSEKVLFLYYLAGPHQNSSGCYGIPDGYAAADLGWPVADVIQRREALVTAGMIDADSDTSEIAIERWFKHCQPDNKMHAIGTASLISRIESDRLREKLEEEISATRFGAVLLSPAMIKDDE